MLITLILLMVAFISGSLEWQSAGANPKADAVPTITPQDPSSLMLALIGGGTLVVYLAVSRTVRRRRPPTLIMRRRLSDSSTDATPTTAPDPRRKSRGAA
jgi:hypothetical protein